MTRIAILMEKKPGEEAFAKDVSRASPLSEFVALQRAVGAEYVWSDMAPARLGPFVRDGRTLAAIAALGLRGRVDTIYSVSEDVGLRAGLLLRASGWRGRLVTVVHAIRPTSTLLRTVGRRVFSDAICVSRRQCELLVEAGFDPARVHWAANWVDVDFFKAQPGRPGETYAFACGLENRDYGALLQAARQLPFEVRISASGFFSTDEGLRAGAPETVKVLTTRMPWTELRDQYDAARFVVVPLNAVDYAAGVTGLVEAMAMGKAVIASASPGIAEYMVEGESGLIVPAADPAALAEAMRTLWNDPARCRAMGRRNRAWVEANASVRAYASRVAEMMTGRPVAGEWPPPRETRRQGVLTAS